MDDKTLTCADCGAEFIFSGGEQKFYRQKGLSHEPKRCRECRSRRKPSADGTGVREERETVPESRSFSATCSACGVLTKLSFKPSPDRPVYCRTCYQARSGMGGSR